MQLTAANVWEFKCFTHGIWGLTNSVVGSQLAVGSTFVDRCKALE